MALRFLPARAPARHSAPLWGKGCLGLLLATCFFCWSNASAQISLIPQVQEIELNRGGKACFNLQVANRGSQPQTLIMTSRAMDISPEGIPFANPGASEWSCADWITFEPTVFNLEADEVQIIECLARGPGDAVGSYSAFITADYRVEAQTVRFEDDKESATTVDFGLAVSSVLLATVRSRENRLELQPDSLVVLSGQRGSQEESRNPFGEVSSDAWHITVPVRNAGNVHAVVRGKASIWTEDMRLVDEVDLSAGRGYVLRGKSRFFRAEGPRVLPDGIYLIKVTLQPQRARMVQGMFPYAVLKGRAIPGAATENVRALMRSFTPQFSLSTNSLDYRINPGAKRTQGVRIRNHSSDSLLVRARLVDWSLNDSGRVVLDPLITDADRSCLSWLDVTPNPLLVPPRRSATAKVKLSAPGEVDGEYYAAVVFETEDAPANLPIGAQLPRTVMITSSSPTTAVYGVEIKSIDYEAVGPLNRVFVVNVANVGNVHCYCMGRLTIFDRFWKKALEFVNFGGETDFILPGKLRGYAVPCPGALENGEYKAVVEVKFHDESPQVNEEFRFVDSQD